VQKIKRRSLLALAAGAATMALSFGSAASASASQFIVSATGEFAGTQTSNQVFTFNNGSVTCKQASSHGMIASTLFTSIENVHVAFSGCSGSIYGISSPVEASEAEFTLWANGEVDLKKAFTLNLRGVGCVVKFLPRAGLKSISYTNKPGKVEGTSALTGISYEFNTTGCGSPAANGTFAGSSLYERVGGGTIQWQA
jgi:hypothetical protein